MPRVDPESRKQYCRERHEQHRERLNAQARQYRADNLERLQAYDRQRYKEMRGLSRGEFLRKTYTAAIRLKYGLSPEAYEMLVIQSKGHCAICAEIPWGGQLDVDHNHQTGQPRGLLCRRCNLGIYYLEESVWLFDAQRYLGHYGKEGSVSK